METNRSIKVLSFICLVLMITSPGQITAAQAERTFTPAELAGCNGQNGAPAYAAVNGLVYDLTNVRGWSGGKHFCPGALAGRDLSAIWNLIPRSHRNPNFLKRFTVVGRLVATKPELATPAPSGGISGPQATAVPSPALVPSPTTVQPRPSLSPSPETPGGTSITKVLITGLIFAGLISLLWVAIRMKRR
ncbi:MAG TPA: hypothetical protein VF531_00270 [Bacillota bacterium]